MSDMENIDFNDERQLRAWCLQWAIEKPYGLYRSEMLETAERYYDFITDTGGVDKGDGDFSQLKRLFEGEVERIKTTPFVASLTPTLAKNDKGQAKAVTIARLLDGECIAQAQYILDAASTIIKRTQIISDEEFRLRLERE